MAQRFILVDSGKSVNDSFILDLKFWKTKYEDVYITDYSFNGEDSEDLKNKNMLRLISTGKVKYEQYFSIEILKDAEFMEEMIEDFYKKIQKIAA